jgi:ribonuclease R
MSKNKYLQYKKHDPFYTRELEKYTDPLPSREYIMQCLDEFGEPLPCEKLIAIFGLENPDAQEALRRRLIAMERQGQLIRNRRGKYALVDQLELIRGRVTGHKDGFGFLVPDDGTGDLFIPPYQMRSLFPGDIVLARAAEGQRGKREAVVVEILEHSTQQIVGRYVHEKNIAFVQPHHKEITQDIVIPAGEEGKAVDGQYVVVEITVHPTARRQATGRVVEVMGDYLSPGMEIEVAMRTHGIPSRWTRSLADEIISLQPEVLEADKVGRKDLRDLPLVTIDGIDAKDFDDAVYCAPNSDGTYRLMVAIADVSHYVLPGSALDQEAYQRGNSVYFPGRVVPMLPEILSNGLCSLKPQVDRLCMVCDMQISAAGELVTATLYDAVMRSRARLIYEEVAAMLAGEKKSQLALLPHLQALQTVYKKMLAQRERRGALDFESVETRIVFGKNQKIEAIIPTKRTEAHRIIEECMLMANVATAQFLMQHKIPTLYRVHKGPNPEKMENLHTFLKSVGLDLFTHDTPTPQDYQKILQRLEKRPDAHLIQTVLLRSLMQAVYAPENLGHFGLAYEAYVHFTSPIRRYPDLLVHRGIRQAIQKGRKKKFAYADADMATFGEHCSKTERRADDATRDAVNWLKCYYMRDKIGQVFSGIITGVTAFGVFVELSNIYVEGLVHISALRDDYYSHDPVQHLLRGKRTGVTYRLGDAIEVSVARANPDERELDLELAQPQEAAAPSKKKKKSTPEKREKKVGATVKK